jgi:hypothetical protein
MAILSCKRLRQVVKVAGSILIAGIFLEVFTHILSSSDSQTMVQPFALGMVLSSPLIMLLTMVVSILSGRRVSGCE